MAHAQFDSVLRYIRKVVSQGLPSERTDTQLLAQFAADRDEAAFAALLERHGPLVWGVCSRVLNHTQDAEDAFQAAFLLLARKATSIRKPQSLGSWLYGVAYRLAIRAKADAAERRVRERRVSEMAQLDPSAEVAWAELRPLLDEELNLMPAKYRQPLILCYLEGKTNRQAAQELGYSEGSMSWRLTKGRELLRARLARRGVALSVGLLGTVLTAKAAAVELPAGLLLTTTRASLAFASGSIAGGAVATQATALTEMVLHALFWTKLKVALSLAVAAVVFGGGGLLAYQLLAVTHGNGVAAKDVNLSQPARQRTAASHPASAAPLDPQPAADGASVRRLSASGRVVGPDGKAVGAANVYLREWTGSQYRRPQPSKPVKDVLARTTTDDQGRFSFKDVAAPAFDQEWVMRESPWDIVVIANGYGPAWKHLTAKAQQESFVLTLPREAKLQGRLLDADGRPVAEGRIQANDIGPLRRHFQHEAVGREGYLYLHDSQIALLANSDAEGRFTLGGLPPNACLGLRITSTGHAEQTLYAATTDGPQPNLIEQSYSSEIVSTRMEPVRTGFWTITLQRGDRLRGQVVLADTGRPVADAAIVLGSDREQIARATTDVEGRFTVEKVPLGRCYVSVWSPKTSADYLMVSSQIEIPATEENVEQIIRLPRGIALVGQVLDAETGKGIARVAINYRPSGASPRRHEVFAGPAETDTEGRFRLAVPSGSGNVTAFSKDREYLWTAAEAVRVSPDEPPAAVKLKVRRAAEVRGRALDPSGNPVPGARVALSSAEQPQYETEGPVTDADGKFSFKGVAIGPHHELVIIHPGRKLGIRTSVPPFADEKREVTVTAPLQPLGTVAGRVVDESQRPIAGAALQVYAHVSLPGNAMTLKNIDSKGLTTDAMGRFRFDELLPVAQFRYSVYASAKGYAGLGSAEFDIRPGANHTVPDIILPLASDSVSGTVVDLQGRPLANAKVRAYPQGGYSGSDEGVTTADGRFRISGLPRRPVELDAELYVAGDEPAPRRYYPPPRVQAQAGQKDVRIVLSIPSGSPVEAVAGEPASEFTVRKWLERAAISGSRDFLRNDFRDKVVLLAFLDEAKPSQRFLPRLNSLHEKWADKGLVVIRVQEVDAGHEAAMEKKLVELSPLPTALVTPGLVAGGYSEAFQKYAVKATPALFLIDRQGILRYRDMELESLPARCEELLKH